jgi:hypothetical protein
LNKQLYKIIDRIIAAKAKGIKNWNPNRFLNSKLNHPIQIAIQYINKIGK